MNTIRGSADFLGLNYYTSRYVELPEQPIGESPSFERDRNLKDVIKPDFKPSASEWLYSYPKGLGDILRYKLNNKFTSRIYCVQMHTSLHDCGLNRNPSKRQTYNKMRVFNWILVYSFIKFYSFRWIKDEYNNPLVFITENGFSDSGGLEDNGRIEYYRDHLQHVQDAVLNNGCNVKAFTAWSIIDNFEWAMGYT